MRYLSTRAAGPASATHSFEDVLLAGLAEDGGLFVPETLPKLDAAALRGLAGLPYAALAIFMLYPQGRISEVQRRQMTTVEAANAHALAIEGNFDDCQDIVKALFADPVLRRELNLSAVNSINFARVAAQIVYYFAAGLALGAASGWAVSFSVPTGKSGNVYA